MKYLIIFASFLFFFGGRTAIAQSVMTLSENEPIIEKTYLNDDLSTDELFTAVKDAIIKEYATINPIISENPTTKTILAKGSVSYYFSGFNPGFGEAEFDLNVRVIDNSYTIKISDFTGRSSVRKEQLDYSDEYRSLFILKSKMNRRVRLKHFYNFETAIMASVSRITKSTGVTGTVN